MGSPLQGGGGGGNSLQVRYEKWGGGGGGFASGPIQKVGGGGGGFASGPIRKVCGGGGGRGAVHFRSDIRKVCVCGWGGGGGGSPLRARYLCLAHRKYLHVPTYILPRYTSPRAQMNL